MLCHLSHNINIKILILSFFFFLCRRERKYFPVHKMSKRMSNTFRRIYKHNLQLTEQGYPSAPEHQSSLSENTPESPVKNALYAELDGSSQARSVVVPPAKSQKSTSTATGVTSDASISPKPTSQKKIRHRRLGSNDSNYTFILPPMPIDRRNVKMVHMETQTDMDVSDSSPCGLLDARDLSSMLQNQMVLASPINCSPTPTVTSIPEHVNENANIETDEEEKENESKDLQRTQSEQLEEAINLSNGNSLVSKSMTDDTVDHMNICSKSNDEQIMSDYDMNSNEQLEIRDSSDEDNVEKLNRRVSEFFNENRLLHTTENGNGIDSRLLFNVMAARRSCISINDKDEVTVVSRSNTFRTNSTASVYNMQIHNDSVNRRNSSASNYKISDLNCNNDDGDDSWTDEEGEDSDRAYSLRRKW